MSDERAVEYTYDAVKVKTNVRNKNVSGTFFTTFFFRKLQLFKAERLGGTVHLF